MSGVVGLEHEPFCGPAAGEDAPRVEAYSLPKYDVTGQYVLEQVRVERCCECAAATYNGRRSEG